MPWKYDQAAGTFTDPTGTLQGKGYSGHPPHTNDPAAEGLESKGPIPKGNWYAVGVEEHTTEHGPFVVVLRPDLNTLQKVVALGREPSTFRIHGERVAPPPGLASEGCIILDRQMRELFWANIDHDIQVV